MYTIFVLFGVGIDDFRERKGNERTHGGLRVKRNEKKLTEMTEEKKIHDPIIKPPPHCMRYLRYLGTVKTVTNATGLVQHDYLKQ